MSQKTKKTKSKTAKKSTAAAKNAPMSNKANDAAKSAPINSRANDLAKEFPAGAPAEIADAPLIGAPPPVLGTLSASDADTELGETKPSRAEPVAPAPKSSIRKKDKPAKSDDDKPNAADDNKPKPAQPQPSVLTAEPPPPAETLDPFRLPRSAFVGIRKSGGLRFTTREVVVYPDGRIAYDARGVPQKEYTRLRRALNDGQVIALRKLLDQTNFWMTQGGGEQNPDAYGYDLAARLGQRSNEITVYDGSVPENLKPLIERLSKFLPEE